MGSEGQGVVSPLSGTGSELVLESVSGVFCFWGAPCLQLLLPLRLRVRIFLAVLKSGPINPSFVTRKRRMESFSLSSIFSMGLTYFASFAAFIIASRNWAYALASSSDPVRWNQGEEYFIVLHDDGQIGGIKRMPDNGGSAHHYASFFNDFHENH